MKLTPALENELERLIHALPDEDLAALARTEPEFLSGGFRAGNTAALRARLRQIAAGAPPLSDPVRRLLARHSLNAGCVRLLSVVALGEQRAALAALFGEPRLLLGMLLDEREEARELANRWLQPGVSPPLPEPAAAAAQAREAFGLLLGAVGATAGAAGAPPVLTREAWQTAREQLEQQLREARAELRRLKGVEERLARAREQLAALERDKAAVETRAVAADNLARQNARERDALRAELEREVNHREGRVAAAVETRLATEAAGWLRAAHAMAREAAALPPAGDDALLARAAAALAHQVAVDRHSGNRAAVAARLELLERQLAQMREVLANALQPAPELASATRELEAEALRLRQTLERHAATPLESAIAARCAAATQEQLAALRGLAEQLGELGALDTAAVARLQETLRRRQEVARAASAPGGAPPEEDDNSALGLLRQAMAGRRPGVLLIDGHNILFGLQGRYQPPAGAATWNASTRARLIEDVVRLTGGRPACRAWIVFDGPARSESTAADNVRVTYSGGSGEHRADLVLLDNVRFFRSADAATAVILASNDNGLGAEARRLGAKIISAAELGALLEQASTAASGKLAS